MIEIKFKSIIITGFRSIKQKLVFQLEREPGLYFISGKNLDEPRLGANGAGKSTIWDAICWVCFGKTVDGTKGDNVINWNLEDNLATCEVIVNLTKDGIETTITRTQNPNGVQLRVGSDPARVVDQSDLDAFLNLDYDRFIHCLIVGQFNATFLEFAPSDKLKLFSGIMPLEIWEQCSKIAGDCTNTFITNTEILAERQRGLGVKQTDQKARLEALGANQRDWEETRQVKIRVLTGQTDNLHSNISKLEAIQKEPESRRELFQDELRDLGLALEHTRDNIKAITLQYNPCLELKTRNQTKYSMLKEELTKWKTINNSCPTCGQILPDSESSLPHIKRITKELVTLGIVLKENKIKQSELEIELKLNNKQLEELQDKQIAVTETIKELNKTLVEIGNDKTLKLQEIRQTREQIDILLAGNNPYKNLIENLNTEMISSVLELEQVTKELEENNKNLNGTEYWIKGFKELRMWMVSDALSALEIESNNALSKLGLVDWEMKFQMERETQKGSISRGFHVLIKSKNYTKNKYIPLKEWSGGERQRLKLGGVIGFSSLVQNYTGVNFNISIWDEPSSYLSKEGIDDLIEFLSEQAEINQKIIYFVDQRHLEASNFKSVITMVKTKEGTTQQC